MQIQTHFRGSQVTQNGLETHFINVFKPTNVYKPFLKRFVLPGYTQVNQKDNTNDRHKSNCKTYSNIQIYISLIKALL